MVEESRPPARRDRASPSAFRFAVCRGCLKAYLEKLALDEGFTSIKIERVKFLEAGHP